MTKEDAKDLTLSVLTVLAALLIAECVWLHIKVAEQAKEICDCKARIEQLENPPREMTFSDKAKAVYEDAKDSTIKGYETAKDAAVKGYQKVKAAAKAGYEAVKEECAK